MNTLIEIDPMTILVSVLLVTLCVLFYLIRKVQRLEKMRDEDKVVMRVRILEKEIEHYVRRSQRRLDIFKRVIDGFDHVVQGIRGVIAEEESDTFETRLSDEEKELLALKKEDEAEVIHIDKQFE
jgi:hypothetical protein